MPHRSAPRFASLEPAYRLRSIDILGAGRPATETPLPRCVAENRLPPHECQGTQKFVIVPDERRIAAVFRHRDAAVASAFRTRVRPGRSIRKGRFPLVSVDRRAHESAAGTPVCPAWAQYGHDMATNETGTVSYRSAPVTTDRKRCRRTPPVPSDRRAVADFGAVGHREYGRTRDHDGPSGEPGEAISLCGNHADGCLNADPRRLSRRSRRHSTRWRRSIASLFHIVRDAPVAPIPVSGAAPR